MTALTKVLVLLHGAVVLGLAYAMQFMPGSILQVIIVVVVLIIFIFIVFVVIIIFIFIVVVVVIIIIILIEVNWFILEKQRGVMRYR